MTNSFNKGDLIHNEKFDEYAVFLGSSPMFKGWIEVLMIRTGEKLSVHDYIWELV